MAERYEIIKKLAQGGFGSVYAAKDCMLGRMVAIKRLLPPDQSASSDIASATFGREATTLASLQHPNIVQIYDYDMDDDGSFVVMELLEGETLGEMLHRGPMSLEDFLQLARQVLEAIGAAHEKGIVHRDLKSDNIFLHRPPTGGWIAKVLDFGLAKFSQQPSKQTIDQKGNIMGSIYFLAPEQFRREALDHRADIYSLGCVFYRTLAGEYPFQGDTVFATMDAHIQHRVLPLREYRPDVPEALEAFIMRLISREPSDRPSDAHEALEEFYAAVASQPSLAGLLKVDKPAETAPAPPPPSPPVSQAPQPRTGPQPPRTGPQAPRTGPQPPRTGAQPTTASRPATRGVPSTPSRPVPSPQPTTEAAQTPADTPGNAYTFLQGNRPAEPAQKKPAPATAAQTASRPVQPVQEKGKGMLFAIIGIAVLLIGAGVYFFLIKKSDTATTGNSSSDSGSGKGASSAEFNAARSLSLDKYDLPNEDLLAWRVSGGVAWFNRGNDGKGYRREPEEKGLVHSWKNIAPKAGESWLEPVAPESNQSAAVWIANNGGLNGYHPYLFFSESAGLTHRFFSSEQEKSPASKKSVASNIGSQGATVYAMFRAGGNRQGQGDMRLLSLRSQSSSDALALYFNEKQGVYILRTSHDGKNADARIQSDELKGANWGIACATWDTVKGEVSLKVRSFKGNVISGNTANLTGPLAPLDTLNIGYKPPAAGQSATEADKPFADLMEVAVYNVALSNDLKTKVLNTMWDHYFKK